MLRRAKRIGDGIVGQCREGKADEAQCNGEFQDRLPSQRADSGAIFSDATPRTEARQRPLKLRESRI